MRIENINGVPTEIIQYDPRPHQAVLDTLIDKRVKTKQGPQFYVPVWHRRAGKSSAFLNILFKVAFSTPGPGSYYYLYPYQKKIREHIWDVLVPKYLPMSQVLKKDDQRMVITGRNGKTIIFDGTDVDPHRHRGADGIGWVIDEYDDQPPVLFPEIIRPIVRFNKGWVIMGGTPRGVKQLHDAYTAGQDSTRPQWWSQLLRADQSVNYDGTRIISDVELEEERRDMVASGIGSAFEQEYFCEFIQGQSQVFRKLDQVVYDKFGNLLKEKDPIEGKFYIIGCDPALTQDYWVNSVIDQHTFEEVCLERFQPQDTNLGEARTEALARKYNNAIIKIDESGLGKPIADHLRNKGLSITALPTGTIKERLITNLSLMVDALTIRFLPDVVAMAEMRDFTFNRLPTGRYQFSAPEGKHDDCVLARSLAVYEIGQPLGIGEINLPESIFGNNNQDKLINSYYGNDHRKG